MAAFTPMQHRELHETNSLPSLPCSTKRSKVGLFYTTETALQHSGNLRICFKLVHERCATLPYILSAPSQHMRGRISRAATGDRCWRLRICFKLVHERCATRPYILSAPSRHMRGRIITC